MKFSTILLLTFMLISSSLSFRLNTDTDRFPSAYEIYLMTNRDGKFFFSSLLHLYISFLFILGGRLQGNNEYLQCLVIIQGSTDASSKESQELCQGIYRDAYNDWLATQ